MDKPKIKLIDKQFAHNPECSFGVGDLKIKPSYFEWYHGIEKQDNDIVVMTESCMKLVDMQIESVKILLILEPPCISPYTYQWIKQPENYQKFNYILTYNEELLSLDKRFIKYLWGGSWIMPEDRQIYPKTKNISIIASWKKDTEGHRLRHEVIERFGDKIDVYGNGYKFVESKLEALKDYRYTIVIENERMDNWMTEKLNDAIATGTVPIYWGCKSVGEYYSKNGMIICKSIEEIENAISVATEENYNKALDYVGYNFEKATELYIPEDRMYQTFFKPVLGL